MYSFRLSVLSLGWVCVVLGAGELLSRPQEPPGGLGAGLSPDDMAAAGQLLRAFTERSVLPKLEERIARLNLSITGAQQLLCFLCLKC